MFDFSTKSFLNSWGTQQENSRRTIFIKILSRESGTKQLKLREPFVIERRAAWTAGSHLCLPAAVGRVWYSGGCVCSDNQPLALQSKSLNLPSEEVPLRLV